VDNLWNVGGTYSCALTLFIVDSKVTPTTTFGESVAGVVLYQPNERLDNMNTLASFLAENQSLENKKLAVWAKGRTIPGYDASVWRHDDFGSVIRYSNYGDRDSKYGWEFDHYPIPAASGGLDTIDNLRPLYWHNNASLGGALGNR
jgi:hypothetical protein